MAVNTPSLRSRGRPPRTPEQHAATRSRILEATSAVYARHGYRGTTVARIVKEARLSRPTFYTFFEGTANAIHTVVTQTQQQIMQRLAAAIQTPDGLAAQISAAIDAYLDSVEEMGDAAKVFHIEAHDPASPASQLRASNDETLIELLRLRMAEIGHPAPTAEAFRVLFVSLQASCFHYLSRPDRNRQATRAAMFRVALALMGSPEDWRAAADHPEMFGG